MNLIKACCFITAMLFMNHNTALSQITVTSPNGGEDWQVGSSHNITWTSAGTSGDVHIEYSVNNGTDWADVIASTPDDGAHTWVIPDAPTDNCLIRVSDTDDDPTDESDAVFTISPIPFVTVTSPNGGEDWQVGSSHNITWTSTGTSGHVHIEYSINNGTDWADVIASTTDDGAHTWVIPDAPTDNCLIRVSDTDDDPTDESNAVFTISPVPLITILSPNGGEDWEVGSSHNITWTSIGTSGHVRIQYSVNNGTDWSNIVANTLDDGIYSWKIPDASSENCLIRVSDTDGDPTDESDWIFTISPIPFVTVTSPNGGEDWEVGSSHNITWTSAGTSGNVHIEYSVNNGTDWADVIASTPDDGIYAWEIPDATADNCLIRVSDTDGDPTDESDAVFSISPIPFVTVTSPNGGEDWQVGSSHDITWTSIGTSGNVRIEYSVNNGISWANVIASTPDDGIHAWTIPDAPSENCLIRVSDTDGDPTDESDAVFTISPIPFITILSPNGGEDWQAGSSHNITWTSTGTSGNVIIWFSSDNGTNWSYVVMNTPDDGSYTWTVPDVPSTNCLISVQDKDYDPFDESDAVFTIDPIPEIVVTSPEGGEGWQVGSSHNITWTSIGTSGNVRIEYSINNGTGWSDIIASTPDDGIYEWIVPDEVSENCLIRITDADGDPAGISDAVFTISPIPYITIFSPNGGEDLEAGSNYEITWTSTGTSGNVIIWFSSDGGTKWSYVVMSTPDDGSYTWTVPEILSTNCLISVQDTDFDPFDESDAVFTIHAIPAIFVTSPEGGEDWQVGSSQEITWTSIGTSGNVHIEYSIDNGTSWADVIASTPDDGLYEWIVSDQVSENCLIRITDADGNPVGISDAVFTISPIPFITIYSPNGGEDLQGNSSYEITWTSSGTGENVIIWFSSDGGTNWSYVIMSTPDDGSYIWTVPNVSSANCLISVQDKDYDPFDESDAVFTINESSSINYSVSESDKMIVYPNPSSDRIHIVFDALHEGMALIEITDISGQVVLKQSYPFIDGVLSIDLEGLKYGMYFLEIATSGKSQTFKIIKEF